MKEFLTLVLHREGQEDKTIEISLGKLRLFAGVAAVVIIGLCWSVYTLHRDRLELLQYREQYGVYTERLEKLAEENERMQKELSQVATLEAQVRELFEKENERIKKEAIDKGSQDSDKAGQGSGMNKANLLDIMEAQSGLTRKRIAYKHENLRNMLMQLSGRSRYVHDGSLLWPTEGGEISSYFGYRRDPFGGIFGEYHAGLDIANNYGAPIYATTDGVVEQAQYNGGYGNFVLLSHGGGKETAYGHMSAIACEAGQKVRRGEVIGYVGSTGASTGPHVHFEIRENGTQVNPLLYLKN